MAIPERYSSFLRNIINKMLNKDPLKRPSIKEIFESLEIKQEVNRLISEYPNFYSNFEPHIFGKKKVKLELEIKECDGHSLMEKKIITPIEKLTINSRQRLTGSTKNKKIEGNSIFNMIEKVKAKSNGNTPQYESVDNIFDNERQTPVSGTGALQSQKNNYDSSIYKQMYSENSMKTKPSLSFTSPSNVSNYSPTSHLLYQQKKKMNAGCNLFDNNVSESPGRQLIARNFLKEKLGENIFIQLLNLKENNPEELLKKIRDILGEDKIKFIPVVEYVLSNRKSLPYINTPSSNMTNHTDYTTQNTI